MTYAFKLHSKLDQHKYPCIFDMQEIMKHVGFAPAVDPYAIDPVFLGRFAALCKYLGVKGFVTSGYRSLQKQIQLYKADGGYQKADGTWTGGTGYVAKPGKSFHNFALAIDTNTAKLKALEKDLSTKMQKTLLQFGLFKPLTKGNGQTVLEDWHIQPIETLDVPLEKRQAMMPTSITAEKETAPVLKVGATGEDVKVLQALLSKKGYKVSTDGDFGNKTADAVKRFQVDNKLVPDGIVGKATWDKLRG